MNDILFRYLPLRISRAVHQLPAEIQENLNEVRLRRGFPVSVTVGQRNLTFDINGRICGAGKGITATDDELKECISRLTEGSLYSYDEFINSGFIPLPDGGRAGICGRANLKNGRSAGFAEIYSVNLRLHRFLPHIARPLIEKFNEGALCGALICSPPALGKTTFLRSTAYLLASGQGISCKRVGIADERSEISVGLKGSGLIDILSGMPKAQAITLLTRTMAPEVIICDEISETETDAVLEAQNTGVHLIASAHCIDPNGLLKRGRMKKLLESGIFPLCVLLGYDGTYTFEVRETEEFL